MPSKLPVIACRTSEELYEKITIIAKKESRSLSKQVEFLIKQCVENYERENGSITINNVNNNINSNIQINNK